jgi:hypothetical protein
MPELRRLEVLRGGGRMSLVCSRISIVSCKGLFKQMFNNYQHRASPDHEASDVGEEEFGHLVFSFLVGCLDND